MIATCLPGTVVRRVLMSLFRESLQSEKLVTNGYHTEEEFERMQSVGKRFLKHVKLDLENILLEFLNSPLKFGRNA